MFLLKIHRVKRRQVELDSMAALMFYPHHFFPVVSPQWQLHFSSKLLGIRHMYGIRHSSHTISTTKAENGKRLYCVHRIITNVFIQIHRVKRWQVELCSMATFNVLPLPHCPSRFPAMATPFLFQAPWELGTCTVLGTVPIQ